MNYNSLLSATVTAKNITKNSSAKLVVSILYLLMFLLATLPKQVFANQVSPYTRIKIKKHDLKGIFEVLENFGSSYTDEMHDYTKPSGKV